MIDTIVPTHMPKIDPVINVKGAPGMPSGAAIDFNAIKMPGTNDNHIKIICIFFHNIFQLM